MTDKNLPATTDSLAGDFLKKFGKAVNDYAIRTYDQSAFLKSAMIAIVDNPDLAGCLKTDQGKLSLYSALRYAGTTGLSLNPQQGEAALIPYGGKISYQIMKNGMITLALESGAVEFITADIVRANDEFTPPANPNDNYTYRPARKDRGPIDGFFAVMKLKSGSLHMKWMTLEEINEHRKKYSEKTRMPEIGYGLKTVLKALLRSVKISDVLDQAIATDDYFEPELHTHGVSADDALEKLKEEKPVAKVENNGGDLL